MRMKKEGEVEKTYPLDPLSRIIDRSTRKQGLQGAPISGRSIPSEMLTSDPPLAPTSKSFQRDRQADSELTF
jgi:hypothetical protein